MNKVFDVGDPCPCDKCEGHLGVVIPYGCACSSVEEPCEVCNNVVISCNQCGWTVEDPDPPPPPKSLRVGDVVTLMGKHDHFERMVVDTLLDCVATPSRDGGFQRLDWFNRYTGECQTSDFLLHPDNLEEKPMNNKPNPGQPVTPPVADHDRSTASLIEEEVGELLRMLLDKNRKYGDSAIHPKRVFSKSGPIEQINVRMDDKLSRIESQQTDDDEDPELDLIGYLILKRVARRVHADEGGE